MPMDDEVGGRPPSGPPTPCAPPSEPAAEAGNPSGVGAHDDAPANGAASEGEPGTLVGGTEPPALLPPTPELAVERSELAASAQTTDGPPPAGDAPTTTSPASTAPAAPAAPRRRRRWIPRQVKWAVSLVVIFFVAEYLLLPELASARKTLDLLGRVNVAWIVLGVVLEALSLASYAELTHTVLSPGAPNRLTLLRVNMSSQAVSHVIPGGTAPGTAVSYRLLSDLNVPGSTVAFGLATQGVGSAVVLNLIFWVALLISIPLRGYNPLYGFAAIAGVILFAIFAGTVLLLTRGRTQAVERVERIAGHLPFVRAESLSALVQKVADRLEILLRDRQLLTHALIWATANWLLDAASLWVFLLAYGHAVSPIDLLVAYGLANVLAVIPITPGGLGVIEGVLIPTLVGFGVPLGIATLGVLTYRLVNFWLPIPVGGGSYLSLRLGTRARQRRREKSASAHPTAQTVKPPTEPAQG